MSDMMAGSMRPAIRRRLATTLARRAPDPVLAPGVRDPRDPELKVLQAFRATLQSHVATVVSAGQTTGALNEPTFSRDVQQPSVLTGNQLVSLAERRVTKAEDTLTDIEDDVKAITQQVQTQTANVASRDLSSDAKAADTELLQKLNKHVARVYDRVQKAVALLNDDRASAERRNHELRAAGIYERLMTQNFYEAKSFITTPDADVLVYDIDVSETPSAVTASAGDISRDLGDPQPAQATEAPQTSGGASEGAL